MAAEHQELTFREAADLMRKVSPGRVDGGRHQQIRVDGGWAFFLNPGFPEVIGERTMVVSDCGRVGRCKIGETVEAAIRRICL